MAKNSRNGKFLVVEGPDASGKQTQTARIAEWMRKQDYSSMDSSREKEILDRMPGKYPEPESEDDIENGVWKLSFPTYDQTPGGRVVKAYLNGRLGDRDELQTMDIVDIYAADRKQFKDVMRDYLDAGGIIICDRYREANLIHQLVGFEDEKWDKMLREIKEVDSDLPDADRIIYLNISPEEAIRRMEDKEKDMHELDTQYMKDSNRNGIKVAENQGWKIIDAEKTIESVESDVKQVIEKIIESK